MKKLDRIKLHQKILDKKRKSIKLADVEKVVSKEIDVFELKTKDGTIIRNKDYKSALRDLATLKGYKVA